MGTGLKDPRLRYLLVVVPALAVAFGLFTLWDRAGQDPLPTISPVPIITTLDAPANGSAYPSDAYVGVSGKAVSAQPLRVLELWVDGALRERKEAGGPEARLLYAYWAWRPEAEGEHTLLLRAVDVTGAVAESRVARVRTTAPVGARVAQEVREQTTVAAAAARLGTTVEALLLANPGLKADDVLLPGQPLYVSVGGTSPDAPAASGSGVAREEANSLPPAMDGQLAGGKPRAPGLAASVDGCTINLRISDLSPDEQGFRVYRLGPDDAFFALDSTIPGNEAGQPPARSVDGVPGHSEFYVTAFNAAGESASDIVAVDLEASACLAEGRGRASIAGDAVLLPEGYLLAAGEFEKVYYYISLDDGPWQRFPAAADEFLPPRNAADLAKADDHSGSDRLWQEAVDGKLRAFDLAAPAAQLAGDVPPGDHDVAVEVWGWAGDKLSLLSRFDRAFKVEGAALAALWPSGLTTLSICGHPGDCREGLGWVGGEQKIDWAESDPKREFRWWTDVEGVTGAVWQLSSAPFGPAFDPTPPGLVATIPLTSRYGEFTFDFAAPEAEPPAGEAPLNPPKDARDASALLAPTVSPAASAADPLSRVFGESGAVGRVLPEGLRRPRTYYARVVPLAGTKQAGLPTETLVIHYGPVDWRENLQVPAGEQESPLVAPPPGIYQLEIAGFKPVVFPDSTLWGCVTITRNDRYTGEVNTFVPDMWTAVSVGTTVCPQVYRGEGEKPWYEQMVGFMSDAVDWAAKKYEEAKNSVVEMVAVTIPFCGENCKAVLNMGVNVALVTMGMPPSLPSFDDLTEAGKGYVITFLAEQAGADCGEGSLCRSAIEEGIDQMAEAAAAGGNNAACGGEEEAHANGREPLCLPPGVVGSPVTGAQYEPAMVEVRLSRPADSPAATEADYMSYRLRVETQVSNDHYAGQTVMVPVNTYMQYGAYVHAQTEQRPLAIEGTLTGSLFAYVDSPAPRLKPGESVTVPIPLQPVSYWFPGHREMIEQAGGYVKYDDWFKLYFQGQMSVSGAVDCFTSMGWTNCGYPKEGWDTFQTTLPADYN